RSVSAPDLRDHVTEGVVRARVPPERHRERVIDGVRVQEEGEDVAQQHRGRVDPADEARLVTRKVRLDPRDDERVPDQGEEDREESVDERGQSTTSRNSCATLGAWTRAE